jgi:hypothetical protein
LSALTIVELDRVTRVAPLGLRFWDALTGALVDGLSVSAIPEVAGAYLGQEQVAVPNRSGVYVFHHLPGLRQAEHGSGDEEYWQDPPQQKGFVVTVLDPQGQFLPFRLSVQAPARGILEWSCATSQPFAPLPRQLPRCVPLFSAPARQATGGIAVLRACLVTGKDQPAPWALVEAFSQGELIARGMADENGQAALFFPYPRFTTDSLVQNRPALTAQTWQIDIRVYFSPAPSYPKIPELCAVLVQPEASPLAVLSPPAPLDLVALKYGKEKILKTQGKSELWID